MIRSGLEDLRNSSLLLLLLRLGSSSRDVIVRLPAEIDQQIQPSGAPDCLILLLLRRGTYQWSTENASGGSRQAKIEATAPSRTT